MYGDNVTYFDGFGVRQISKEIKKAIGNTKIMKILFWNTSIQFNNMRILLHFPLQGKILLEDTNLFSPNEYEKNDKQYHVKRIN